MIYEMNFEPFKGRTPEVREILETWEDDRASSYVLSHVDLRIGHMICYNHDSDQIWMYDSDSGIEMVVTNNRLEAYVECQKCEYRELESAFVLERGKSECSGCHELIREITGIMTEEEAIIEKAKEFGVALQCKCGKWYKNAICLDDCKNRGHK